MLPLSVLCLELLPRSGSFACPPPLEDSIHPLQNPSWTSLTTAAPSLHSSLSPSNDPVYFLPSSFFPPRSCVFIRFRAHCLNRPIVCEHREGGDSTCQGDQNPPRTTSVCGTREDKGGVDPGVEPLRMETRQTRLPLSPQHNPHGGGGPSNLVFEESDPWLKSGRTWWGGGNFAL